MSSNHILYVALGFDLRNSYPITRYPSITLMCFLLLAGVPHAAILTASSHVPPSHLVQRSPL